MNDYNPRLGMADLVIQGVLLTLVIVPDIFAVFTDNSALLLGMFFQIFLGAYQVLSGVIGAVKQRVGRGRYLAVAGVYMIFFFLWLGIFGGLNLSSYIGMPLLILCLIVLPVSIGIWYFVTCVKEYKASKTPNIIMDMPDVLDVGLQ